MDSSLSSPLLVVLGEIHATLVTDYLWRLQGQCTFPVSVWWGGSWWLEFVGRGFVLPSFHNSTTSSRPDLHPVGSGHLQHCCHPHSRLIVGSLTRWSNTWSRFRSSRFQEIFVVSHHTEQIHLHWTHHIVDTTVEVSLDLVLCTEMEDLELQEGDDPKLVLWYTPMSWIGVIRSHHRDTM
jgi:hypothetical protein